MANTAIVLRLMATDDGWAGQDLTWATLAEVPCHLIPKIIHNTGGEQVAEGQIQSITQWSVALPWGTDVDEKDRVVVGAQQFEVSSVIGTQTYAPEVLCILAEVT